MIPEEDITVTLSKTLQALIGLINTSQAMTFGEAFETLGAQELPTMDDLAQMHSKFAAEGVAIDLASGNLTEPSKQYFWVGEFLGTAPTHHPAAGKLIHASLTGLYPRTGLVVASPQRYAVIRAEVGTPYFIREFYKFNGFMTPSTSSNFTTTWQNQVSIVVKNNQNPASFRPSRWSKGLSFTSDPAEFQYTAVRRSHLLKLL